MEKNKKTGPTQRENPKKSPGIVISFGTQKGGGGKTTMSMIYATYLNHYTNLEICAIDTDILQKSLYNKRVEEQAELKELISNNELTYNSNYYKALKNLSTNNTKLYDIILEPVKEIKNSIEELRKKYDIIIIDLPGSMDVEGMGSALFNVDYFFIPIYAEEKNTKSALEFISTLHKLKELKGSKIKEFYPFLFRYSDRRRTADFNLLREYLSQNNLKILENVVYDSIYIETGVSTIIPLKRENQKMDIFKILNEIDNLLKINHHGQE